MAAGRLCELRLAVSQPPRDWFNGIAWKFYEAYRAALAGLGCRLFDVPVEPFVAGTRNETDFAALIEDLRAFRPELAIGLPLGSYALICRMPFADNDGYRPNLFTDILDIPTICLWDHAPLELAEQLLTPHPKTPRASRPGVLAGLTRAIGHPRVIHWSRDSGQSALMQELGFISAPPIHDLSPALPATVQTPARPEGVAFIGQFYDRDRSFGGDPRLEVLYQKGLQRWFAEGGALWHALHAEIDAMPEAHWQSLALGRDDHFYWAWTNRAIRHAAQAEQRLRLLGGAGRPVICYGNLSATSDVPANLTSVPGHIPLEQLDAVYARHAITIDVSNPGFIAGVSHKAMHGFASGGFLLTDRKDDFVQAFGELGEAVSYRDPADLAAKTDLYLGNDRLRREIAAGMRDRIDSRHRLPDVLARVIDQATSSGASATPPAPRRPVEIEELLPKVKRFRPWHRLRRSAGEVAIETPAKIWTWTARLNLPPLDGLRAPRLRLRAIVDSGRLGLNIQRRTDDPEAIFFTIEPGDKVLDFEIALPRARDLKIYFHNSSDAPCCFRLHSAMLLDRA